MQSISEQCIHKLVRDERPQVLYSFSQAYESYGYFCLLSDSENDAPFGGAIELGQNNTSDAYGLMELFDLVHGVLAQGRVQDYQNLMRGAGIDFADDPFDLL